MSNGDFSKIVWSAFVVVVMAAVVLGLVIGYDMKLHQPQFPVRQKRQT